MQSLVEVGGVRLLALCPLSTQSGHARFLSTFPETTSDDDNNHYDEGYDGEGKGERAMEAWKPSFCGPSVVASIESNLASDGPKSLSIIYWDPSSTPCALLDTWPAISAPAPINMLTPTNFVPVLRVPRKVFLIGFCESFPDHFQGISLMAEHRAPFLFLKVPYTFLLEVLDAPCFD